MTDETPALDAALEQHIHELSWGDDVDNFTQTLVAGNIRGAVGNLVENGALIPVDVVQARVGELYNTASGILENRIKALESEVARLGNIKATIRVNALRHGASDEQVERFLDGRDDFVKWLSDTVERKVSN